MYLTFEKYFKESKTHDINHIKHMLEVGVWDHKEGLYYSCLMGYLDIVKLFIEICAKLFKYSNWYEFLIYECWNYGLCGACHGGHIDIVKLVLEQGAYNYDEGLDIACREGYLEIIDLLILQKSLSKHYTAKYHIYHEHGLSGACEGGKLEIINLLIKKGVNNWDQGLQGACKGGQLEIINLMASKGANNWNLGLKGACYGGQLEIAKLMILKGADDYEGGLINACLEGHLKLVNLMIEQGANDWNFAIQCACKGNHLELVELMISKGAFTNYSDILLLFENCIQLSKSNKIIKLVMETYKTIDKPVRFNNLDFKLWASWNFRHTENLELYGLYLKNKRHFDSRYDSDFDINHYKKLLLYDPVYYLLINKKLSKLYSIPIDLIRYLRTFINLLLPPFN